MAGKNFAVAVKQSRPKHSACHGLTRLTVRTTHTARFFKRLNKKPTIKRQNAMTEQA